MTLLIKKTFLFSLWYWVVWGGSSVLYAEQPVLRHVLGIYDSQVDRQRIIPLKEPPGEHNSIEGIPNPIQANLAMVLNHLGYMVEALDIRNDPLPLPEVMERYALIITWFPEGATLPQPESFVEWLETQVQQGRKYLSIGPTGLDWGNRPNRLELKKRLYRTIDIDYGSDYQSQTNRIRLVSKEASMVEFEHRLTLPLPWYDLYRPLNPQVRSYLTVRDQVRSNSESVMVSIGPKGGMIAPGYALFRETKPPFRRKWRVDPFRFLRTLLHPQHPIPDVTTSQGKRLFYAHIDGDGFRNESELEFNKLSSEIILERIIRHYPQIPLGVSVIVGDIASQWLGETRHQKIARDIFAQPNVEAATHTYTHPYQWQRWDRTAAYSPIGMARYEREIDESIHWINENLLPKGKQVKLVYWSGDTTPPEEVLRRTEALGVDHLNGGDAKKDNQFPSYTSVSPLMRPVGKRWQIFTSASNENLYTQLWTANFHGFRNVIQTFENTERPIRVLPVNVYYHFYIGDKVAAFESLRQVYEWVLKQDLKMIYPSEYVRWVRGFIATQIIQIAPQTYQIRNRGGLNTLRLDMGEVDLTRSEGVLHAHRINQKWYLDLDPRVLEPLVVLKNVR